MEITEIKRLTEPGYINMFKIGYRDKHDRQRHWQLVTRQSKPKCVTGEFDVPDAVIIVPFHRVHRKLVIIKEFRVPLGGYQYGLPAGLVDEGESIETAADRELMEETGLRLTKVLKSSPPVYSSSGMTDESITLVYVECEGVSHNRNNESSEDIETLLVTAEEADRICRDPSAKIDVKTWLVMWHYIEHGNI